MASETLFSTESVVAQRQPKTDRLILAREGKKGIREKRG